MVGAMAEQEATHSLSPRRAVQTLLQHIHEGFVGVKRRYSTTLIYGDGSADHGDKHTGHVRKTVQDT